MEGEIWRGRGDLGMFKSTISCVSMKIFLGENGEYPSAVGDFLKLVTMATKGIFVYE